MFREFAKNPRYKLPTILLATVIVGLVAWAAYSPPEKDAISVPYSYIEEQSTTT
jgi:hypothetical protein